MVARGYIVVSMFVGVALGADPSAAKCAMQELAPDVITPAGAQLPPDGGVLVGYTWTTHGGVRDRDPSQPDEWWFSTPTKLHALAPGLTVYLPTTHAGTLKVTNKNADTIATFVLADKASAAALPAPTPIAATLAVGNRPRYNATMVTVELADAPPADAIGVITYKGGVAIDFARFEPGGRPGKRVDVHRDPGRCRFGPSTIVVPAIGDAIAIAWVDAFGRVSKKSAAVNVAGAKH